METISRNLASIQEAAALRSRLVINTDLLGGFLIGSSLLGLQIIIGAFWYNRSNLSLFKRSFTCQENRLMGLQLVYSCLLTLLIMVALNLIVAIIFGVSLVSSSCYNPINCYLTEDIWFLSRWFGVIIHLVNASLSIYNMHHPLSVTRVHTTYLMVSVVIIIVVPLSRSFYKAAIFTLAAFMFLFALSVIVASRGSTSSPSTSTLKKWIIVVATCNFLVVYIPTFILQCLMYTADFTDLVKYENAYLYVLYLTNLHLIFDGLQCALFLKLPSGEEQQQQQQELQQWKPEQEQQQYQPQQQQQQWRQQQYQPQQEQQWRQQQYQPQQEQQWRQQQYQPQQQQKLGFQNAGFTGSTNVYQ